MPSGLFRKEGERWVVNLAQPPASASELSRRSCAVAGSLHVPVEPDEQRALLATGPATTAAPTAATTQHHARAKKKKTRSHHRRGRAKSGAWTSSGCGSGEFRIRACSVLS